MFDHPKILVKEVFCYFTEYCGSIGWYSFDSYRGRVVMQVRPGAVCRVEESIAA